MAIKAIKISELPAAGILDGTELLEVVKNATNTQTSLADIRGVVQTTGQSTEKVMSQKAVTDLVGDVEGQMTAAQDAADRAEAASDAAFVNADVYPTVAEGLADVADGEQFQVVEDDEIVRYRRESLTTQSEVARYPTPNLVYSLGVKSNELRQDLASPDLGATLVSGAVIYVDTVTDLRDMDTGSLVDGRIVQVRSAGEFTWDSAKGRFRYTDAGKPAKMVGYHDSPTILSLPSPISWVIGEIDGNLYAVGAVAGIIYESTDLGQSWQAVHTFTAGGLGSNNATIYSTNDGEVLVSTSTTLFKSSGWSADTSTATFTQVLQVTNPAAEQFHRGWGFSVVDNYIMVTEYGQPKPTAFFSYLSTDNGNTFAKVFDLRDNEAGTSNAHNHGCCIDPWHNYRLWQATADTGNIGTHYSDDLGATWTRMPNENQHIGTALKATSMIATERGIILGSDDRPNGVWMIPRDDNYTTSPTMQSLYELRTGSVGLTHIGSKHVLVDGIVYTGFAKSLDYPAVVTATDVESGETWMVWDNAPPASFRLPLGGGFTGLHDIFYAQDTLIIQLTGSYNLVMCPIYEASATRTNTLEVVDTGHVLGGMSNPDQEAVSVGMLAYAGGMTSTAVGTRAVASGNRGIAVGAESTAGTDAIAIGCSATALLRGTAFGFQASSSGVDSVAIGRLASTSEVATNAVVVGTGASTTSASAVVIGQGATSSVGAESIAIGSSANGGNRGIAVGVRANANGKIQAMAFGYQANATVNYSLAIGADAHVTGSSGIAIGWNAAAAHSESVAIGAGVITTSNNQVKFKNGNHIELGNRVSALPAPAETTNARIGVRTSNGVQQLVVMFGNGQLKVIADDTTGE